MSQRVIFINLHTCWMLLKNTEVLYFKRSAALKHKYLLDFLIKNPNFEVCSYITKNGFSLSSKSPGYLAPLLNSFRFMEHKLIMKKNHINEKSITIITKPEEIKKEDILILYNIIPNNLDDAMQLNAFKALSMLHFHGREEENEKIVKTNIQCFINEANLKETSAIFNTFYHINKPWIIIPFVYGSRFKRCKAFNERISKCFSTGTITYKPTKEFLSIYSDPCLQPMRKIVKDNVEYFTNTIDCYSFNYFEDNSGKKHYPSDNFIVTLYKKIYNLRHIGKQRQYFSFDMAEKFNSYKMHLIGEEIIGVPGIGFVEGMACGSAYIGIDSPMYRNMGLIPGFHYISYDGTKEGLKKTIEFWQLPENQKQLEVIADNGYKFVTSHFVGDCVAESLMTKLLAMKANPIQ